jgi:hypothetical protein
MQYRTFNTGDQIWVRRLTNGQEVSVKVITYDGLFWDEEDGFLYPKKLTGIEYAVNWLVVKTIQFNHWLVG